MQSAQLQKEIWYNKLSYEKQKIAERDCFDHIDSSELNSLEWLKL